MRKKRKTLPLELGLHGRIYELLEYYCGFDNFECQHKILLRLVHLAQLYTSDEIVFRVQLCFLNVCINFKEQEVIRCLADEVLNTDYFQERERLAYDSYRMAVHLIEANEYQYARKYILHGLNSPSSVAGDKGTRPREMLKVATLYIELRQGNWEAVESLLVELQPIDHERLLQTTYFRHSIVLLQTLKPELGQKALAMFSDVSFPLGEEDEPQSPT